MSIKNEERILRKVIPEFKKLSAAELSSEIIAGLSPQEQKPFMEANRKRRRYCLEAEEELRRGRAKHALELLEYGLGMSYYGREYSYGLMGDAYRKLGDLEKAEEMYRKSGSHDSLKKLQQLKGRSTGE
jgi:tetratricopeptide (TPR) repeat protein